MPAGDPPCRVPVMGALSNLLRTRGRVELDDGLVYGTVRARRDNWGADETRRESWRVGLSHVIRWTLLPGTQRKWTVPIFPRWIGGGTTLCRGTAAAVAKAGQVGGAT